MCWPMLYQFLCSFMLKIKILLLNKSGLDSSIRLFRNSCDINTSLFLFLLWFSWRLEESSGFSLILVFWFRIHVIFVWFLLFSSIRWRILELFCAFFSRKSCHYGTYSGFCGVEFLGSCNLDKILLVWELWHFLKGVFSPIFFELTWFLSLGSGVWRFLKGVFFPYFLQTYLISFSGVCVCVFYSFGFGVFLLFFGLCSFGLYSF